MKRKSSQRLVAAGAGVRTCVRAQQPGADERSERLARFGQQGHHPEEESRRRELTPVHHKVLVHQIRNDQLQQFARPLCKHPVTRWKKQETVWKVIRAQQSASLCKTTLCSVKKRL